MISNAIVAQILKKDKREKEKSRKNRALVTADKREERKDVESATPTDLK